MTGNNSQQSHLLYHLTLIPLITGTLMGSLLLLFCDINDFLGLIFFLYVSVIISCVFLYKILVNNNQDNTIGVINTVVSIYFSYLSIKLLFFNSHQDLFLIIASLILAISAIAMLAISFFICIKKHQPFLLGIAAGVLGSIIINFVSSFL